MEESGPRILVDGLVFTYPGSSTPALDGITIEFESGKLCAVLGRNGSGKSTLARCLNGLLLPSRGRIVSCGFDTSVTESSTDIKRRIAMVFQNPDTQMIGTTVEEEVAFGPENLGLPRDEIRKRVDEAMAMAGIAEMSHRQPLRLSQGQKQLVAIAGALAMKPDFLISDESTSMLDYDSRSRITELFVSMKERGIGIIHVTHFLEEAASADTVAVLDAGRLTAVGAPRDIIGDPGSVRRMGLDPLPATIVAGELAALGHPCRGPVLQIEELLSWLGT